jgi:hypothetical protein
MAMIYFDSADAVQRTIVAHVGQKIGIALSQLAVGQNRKGTCPLPRREVHA